MAEGDDNLNATYHAAESKRSKLDQLPSSTSEEYQDLLKAAIDEYQRCLQLVERLSLFSPNESIEDVSTNDIEYLLVRYHIAELLQRRSNGARKSILQEAQVHFSAFLQQLDRYDMLDKSDVSMLERLLENPNRFSVTSNHDPTARRETKIQRYKQEQDMKQRLEILRSKSIGSTDEETLRELRLQQVTFAAHQSFQQLESIAQEMHILSLAPASPPGSDGQSLQDRRDRTRNSDGYSDRLDGSLSAGLTGPLLDAKGRPMRPFTLLDKRQQLREGVFRPDHSLPTMSIDEYLEEERRRGGIIEGGGPQSGTRPEPNEDDMDAADAETMKARAWDEFKEENPKGAGNTLNRG